MAGLFTVGEYESCYRCMGGGHDNEAGKPGVCWECGGTGLRLTDAGRELVRFLEQHFDLKPKVEP